MSYFNEINGYLSSLKESQNNEATMANEMASKKAQSIEDRFSSINSSIESAGGIMVAGADGWFKGRKILEKLGKAVKGKGGSGSGGGTGTDITTPQTRTSGMTSQTSSATTGDKAPSVADSDLTPSSFGRTINTSVDTGGRVSVPRGGLKRNQPSTKPDNNPAPEADSGGGSASASSSSVPPPLADTKSSTASAMTPDDVDAISNLRTSLRQSFNLQTPLGAPAPTASASASTPSSNLLASQSTDTRLSSLIRQQVAKGKQRASQLVDDNLGRPPPATPALGTKPIAPSGAQPNGSTEGGGGSGGGSSGNQPSTNLKDTLPDGDIKVSGDMDGIANSLTDQIKQKGSQFLKDGADSLGVDTDAVMGAANVALDGIPIIGEIFGIGTMIAGLARDIGDKGNVDKKAAEASDSTLSSARGAVDTGNVASTGATTAGSYIA